MKITEKILPPVTPLKTVILELTEAEADLIRVFATYYVTSGSGAGFPSLAARRLYNQLEGYSGCSSYPYTDAFKKSK